MSGSIKGNNKQNPWIHQYDVKIGNTWTKKGTKARVYNSIYSPNSKAGAQKSAGGRRTLVIHEEIGLTSELIQAWGSNEGMIREGGINKMAGQKGIGTSGNMETIGPAKKIFTHPDDFDCLKFKYREDPDGDYGFFIPSYIVDPKFKDDNGNTDVEAAYRAHKEKYDEVRETSLPEVFLEYRMNFPLKIEDMWVQGMGELLPVREAEQREKELMKGGLYKSLGQAIKLYWDNSIQGITYDFDRDAQPFYEWPLGTDRKTLNSVFMMYIHPDKLKINGQIPNDAVIVLHDPYISEEQDKGGSLGAAYFIVNPKYISHGLPGNCIAASLIGKHERGTDGFNEQLELGMHFYGNPIMGLWYEANRGDKLRSYFVKKRKHHLLCLRPQFEQGQWLFSKNVTQTGYVVGNRLNRMSLIDSFRDWLLDETEIDGELKRNIFRLPCIFLLRQIKQYNLNMNFDAVDAMMGISLALGEQEHRIINRENSNNTTYAPLKNFIKKKMRV